MSKSVTRTKTVIKTIRDGTNYTMGFKKGNDLVDVVCDIITLGGFSLSELAKINDTVKAEVPSCNE